MQKQMGDDKWNVLQNKQHTIVHVTLRRIYFYSAAFLSTRNEFQFLGAFFFAAKQNEVVNS